MRSRPAALAACLAATALAPAAGASAAAPAPAPAAGGPSIQVDRQCYADPSLRDDRVRLTGTGFTPNARYQVTLDGKPLPSGIGAADATGSIDGTFAAPMLSAVGHGVREHFYALAVHEITNPQVAASTRFGVSRLLVRFRPAKGDPRTLRVTYALFGFALQGLTTPTVYVHWIRPDGRLRRTERLGVARGACGAIHASGRKRLFPFRPERGTWRLQFDTSRRFRHGRMHGSFLFYSLTVAVKART